VAVYSDPLRQDSCRFLRPSDKRGEEATMT
jgi:hypothetical protein